MKKLTLLLIFAASLAWSQTLINGSRVLTGTLNYCADAGASDAYACSLSPAITAYAAGGRYTFKANTSNTGGATLALNGLTATAIVKYVGGVAQALADNDIRAGGIYEVLFDGTNFQVLSNLGNDGSYTLPTASISVLGGVKVGTNLSIDGSGVLSAAGGSITCDPFDLTKYCFVEDFAFGATSVGNIGSGALSWYAISSGTFSPASVTSPSAITQHPGVVKMTSTTVAGSGGRLIATNATTGWLNFDDQMNEEWELRWVAKIDSTSDTRTRIGFVSGSGVAPGTNEVSLMFRYDVDATYSDNTKNTGLGSWVAQFCGYSGGTCAGDTQGVYKVLNVAPDTNFHLFTLAKAGSTYTWSIDGTAYATMCASGCDMTTPTVNSPTGISVAPSVYFGISSTTQRNIYIDYLSFKMSGIVRY